MQGTFSLARAAFAEGMVTGVEIWDLDTNAASLQAVSRNSDFGSGIVDGTRHVTLGDRSEF